MIVPHSSIKLILVQQELGERRRNQITTIQEYNIEIKHANLVRGQGLCKLVAESQDTLNDIASEDGWENEIEMFCNEMIPF